ncbi:RING-H2 finger protein ATL22-like [Eucalyptus grandis]|uniref:RING-H2 finger protein ATL22-like n=1 Tax=Eucalyptus grandis TaxID=71139 RepID=UPI00192EEACA|nr:RING-H2 finger protein ATL22-like [Eucalyptus grandis]
MVPSVLHDMIEEILKIAIRCIRAFVKSASKGHHEAIGGQSPGGPEIRFPFRANDSYLERCGYPGFNLSCNTQGQAILQLPNSQDFIVDLVDYKEQYIVLRDPGNCLAKRLQHLTLSSSVFSAQEYGNFTFADCVIDLSGLGFERVDCLSDGQHTVYAAAPGAFPTYFSFISRRTWTVSVPVARQYPTDVTKSVVLKWDAPDCRSCEKSGGKCGFKGSAGSDVGCFVKHGLSKRAKLGIILGILLPLLLCISGLAFYLSSRGRVSEQRDPHDQPPNSNNGESNISNITSPSSSSRETRHASYGVVGIDLVTIESYPKIQVDDDGQVPRPNDNICAICLSEYQPKETLRTIPNCGHYFHAQCIDQWLGQNASCPLCRDHKAYV